MSREVTHRGRTYTVSDAHPVADEYDWLEEDEMDALAEDIKQNRQRLPIRTLPDGRILDGRNRELACLIAGVDPEYKVANLAEFEVRGFVASLNDKRRHESAEARRQRVAQLRSQGMSTRAIAAEMDIDPKQVRRDLNKVGTLSPPAAGESDATAAQREEAHLEPAEVGTLSPPVPEPAVVPEVVARPPESPIPPAVVTGRDGKTYAATKPKLKADLKDARGRVVPEPLVAAFAAGRAKLARWRELLNEIGSDLEGATTEPWGAWFGLVTQSVGTELKKASEDLGAAVPHTVCPWVCEKGIHTPKRTGKDGRCEVCLDRLFMGRHQWHQLRDDVKREIDSFTERKPDSLGSNATADPTAAA